MAAAVVTDPPAVANRVKAQMAKLELGRREVGHLRPLAVDHIQHVLLAMRLPH